MMRLSKRATNKAQLFQGMNGHDYVVSLNKAAAEEVARAIGRRSGVYFRLGASDQGGVGSGRRRIKGQCGNCLGECPYKRSYFKGVGRLTIYEYVLFKQPWVIMLLRQLGLLNNQLDKQIIDEKLTRNDIISLMRHDRWQRTRGAMRQVHPRGVIR